METSAEETKESEDLKVEAASDEAVEDLEDDNKDAYEDSRAEVAVAEPVEVEVGEGDVVTVEIKNHIGSFKYAGKWYNLPKGKHKVPKVVKNVLKIRGDLG